MKGKHLDNKLWEYLEGKLAGAEKEAVESHLGQCADCQKALERIMKMERVIRKECSQEVSPFLFTRIQGRMEREMTPPLAPRWQGALLSLVMILAIWGGVKIGSLTHSSQNVISQIPEYQLVNEIHQEPIEMFLLKE